LYQYIFVLLPEKDVALDVPHATSTKTPVVEVLKVLSIPGPIHRCAWKGCSQKLVSFRCTWKLSMTGCKVAHFKWFIASSDQGMRKGPKDTHSREGQTMTEASRQPKDKNYNLISVLYHSSDNIESLKSYIQDAEAEGDQELVEFFSAVLENNLEAAQRAKEMLVPRFQSEQE
jgi:hypothetical protein